MAKTETWEKLRYFKKDSTIDKFGDVDALADSVLLRVDDFRHYIGHPVYITSGVRPESDGKTSYHTRSKGSCALDIVCPEYTGHPIDLIFTAMRFGFHGIGYYPHWQWNGIKCGGLHVDDRPLGMDQDGTINYSQSLWMAIKVPVTLADGTKSTMQKYIPLNYANVIRNIREGVLP